jgi:hypothetical protein
MQGSGYCRASPLLSGFAFTFGLRLCFRTVLAMSVHTCVLCKAEFVRSSHLEEHVGSRRCKMNVIGQATGVCKRPAASELQSSRWFSGQGNVKRTIKRKIKPFIVYLKHNAANRSFRFISVLCLRAKGIKPYTLFLTSLVVSGCICFFRGDFQSI